MLIMLDLAKRIRQVRNGSSCFVLNYNKGWSDGCQENNKNKYLNARKANGQLLRTIVELIRTTTPA